MSEKKNQQEIRFISPEPVLAEILSKHKPILISETGWNWIVGWIATIGTIMRSRDYIAFNISYIISMVGMSKFMDLLDKLGIGKFVPNVIKKTYR